MTIGSFTEIEPLNRSFTPGYPKLKITVDTETVPSLPDYALLERLVEALPGLTRHQCRAQDGLPARVAAGTRIMLLDTGSSANQAHVLEHLTLEMLSALENVRRLSGVTCAYDTPQERNDVFVECPVPESGAIVVLLAVEAMNATLAGRSLTPLFPDVMQCTGLLRSNARTPWPASR